MNLTEYAWGTMLSISQKKADEIKLLFQDDGYPKLDRDAQGYVLRIVRPTQPREGVLALHQLFFDNDSRGRAAVWRLFNASLNHLALHTAITDYAIYRGLGKSRGNLKNLMFAISLVEDFALKGYMRSKLPGLLFNAAYANHVAYLRFRELSIERDDPADLIAANLLSLATVGRLRLRLNEKLDQEITSLHSKLRSLESVTFRVFSYTGKGSPLKDFWSQGSTLASLKVQTADLLYSFFNRNSAVLSAIHSLPHVEAHDVNGHYLFEKSALTATPEERSEALKLGCQELSIAFIKEAVSDPEKAGDMESRTVLDSWLDSLNTNQSLVDQYSRLDPASHFEKYLLPPEDYSEFMRIRAKVAGPIRAVLDQLRQVKSDIDERQNEESGYVDMQKAIQYIASKTNANDYFARQEIETKNEAWAIIIDASKSLEWIQGEAKDIAICIMEVAKDLFNTSDSWGCYAFNESFYIIKDFSEPYGNVVKSRAGGISTGVKTLLPDALRLAGIRLAKQNAELKAILVISDGFPLGYEGIEQDLIKVIEQITARGTLLLGLGVGSSAIEKYFKLNCVINQPADLMKQFVKTYLEVPNLI